MNVTKIMTNWYALYSVVEIAQLWYDHFCRYTWISPEIRILKILIPTYIVYENLGIFFFHLREIPFMRGFLGN